MDVGNSDVTLTGFAERTLRRTVSKNVTRFAKQLSRIGCAKLARVRGAFGQFESV
jgi:hypothetical protein